MYQTPKMRSSDGPPICRNLHAEAAQYIALQRIMPIRRGEDMPEGEASSAPLPKDFKVAKVAKVVKVFKVAKVLKGLKDIPLNSKAPAALCATVFSRHAHTRPAYRISGSRDRPSGWPGAPGWSRS